MHAQLIGGCDCGESEIVAAVIEDGCISVTKFNDNEEKIACTSVKIYQKLENSNEVYENIGSVICIGRYFVIQYQFELKPFYGMSGCQKSDSSGEGGEVM